MCERQGKCAKSYRAEGHFHVCTQGQSVAECTKRGRAAVIVVLSPVPLTQPSQLFSLSATLAHMPVSCNCGLIPSLSIFFLFFFLLNHPLLSLSCRSVASNDLSPCFLLLALPCSTSSIFHPIIFSPLSFSFFSSLFPLADPMFVCVNSWDAFVDRFHSDETFEQVVIHVRLL